MKKTVSIIICLIFIVSSICGCSSTSDETSTVTSDISETADNASESQTTDEYPVLENSDVTINNLSVNYEKEPGCVENYPSFSWTLDSYRRGAYQKYYRIFVATDVSKLSNETDLFWDSGRIESSETLNIRCDKELDEAVRYYWKVKIIDDKGNTAFSDISHFDSALVKSGFDGADWITEDPSVSSKSDFSGCSWIWLLNGDKQGNIDEKTEYFRYSFEIKKEIAEAYASFTSDDYGDLYLNGTKAVSMDESRGWENAVCVDAAPFLKVGDNLIACSAVNKQVGYGAVLVKIYIIYTDGTEDTFATNSKWKASENYSANWYKTDFDDSDYQTVNSVIKYGGNPWYESVSFPDLSKGAPILRKEFEVKNGVKNAFLFASAAGLYDAYINGGKASADVLDPGRSEYNVRVMYQCHDVTNLIQEGTNCVGAVLGRGWYIGAASPYGGKHPAFICKLVINYENGDTQTVCTDNSWKFTYDGPIIYDDIFDGETYDARRELDGWSSAGYDDSFWYSVITTKSKNLGIGELVPQLSGTVKVMDTVPAKAMTEPKKNTYVYDFGQNLAGVVAIKITGSAGTVIKLRHAEMLNDGNNGSDGPAGTIYALRACD